MLLGYANGYRGDERAPGIDSIWPHPGLVHEKKNIIYHRIPKLGPIPNMGRFMSRLDSTSFL